MSWPKDVGILGLELYFPSNFVDQNELEAHDGVSAGKYTIGLGQNKMGFCSDREDINSLCLTALENLLQKHQISYDSIGRLEVGTETILDKSKSVKSVLMQLFAKSGNTDIEGVDSTNACYGGTAALFNSVNWVESSAWDGRYAVVVCGDIAVYASGAARPTGGAGAVAMLIGPNAPLVIERGLRSTHSNHVYDFYKPDLESEYPRVDGKLSIQCYLSSLDKCFELYKEKALKKNNEKINLESFNGIIFHSPYCKLVQKSLARLLLNDVIVMDSNEIQSKYPGLETLKSTKLEESYFDRDVEKLLLNGSGGLFQKLTQPSLHVANQVGNMYTPSVYGGLISYLISKPSTELIGNRICLFSYGSGSIASMYSITINNNNPTTFNKLFYGIKDVSKNLQSRNKIHPELFSKTMKLREEVHHLAPYTPVGSVEELFPGTYYLESIDEMHRRTYLRRDDGKTSNGSK